MALLKGALEDNILTLICWVDDSCMEARLSLTVNLFSTRAYRRIAEAAFGYIDKFGKAPKVHLRDLLEENLRQGAEGQLLGITLDAMDALRQEMDCEFVLSQLNHFVETRNITHSLERAADALQAGNTALAQELLSNHTSRAETSGGTLLSDPKQALAFLDTKEDDFFSSGIDLLDDLGVRPSRGTLTLLIGPAKAGKSWWLINVGKAAIMQRKKVLHITLENSEALTAARYVQSLFSLQLHQEKAIKVPTFTRDEEGRCTGLNFDTLTPGIISNQTRQEVSKKIRTLFRRRPELLIKEFPTGTLTVSQLKAYMIMLSKVKKFIPDLVLVDYPDLMKMGENIREDTGRTFIMLRGLAIELDFALCAVTQGNRSSSRAKLVQSDMVAEDWSKVATADTVLTLSKTKSERDIGLARIFVAAARSVRDQMLILVSQAYEIGQFALDSVFMTNALKKDIGDRETPDAD